MWNHFPGGRMTQEGNKPHRTQGTLCAPPRTGHGSDPGGVKPPHPALPQM